MAVEERTSSASSVLVIDSSSECRDVLCTLLARRGVRTWQAAGARQGLEMMRRHLPDVVVLDADSESADDANVRRQYGKPSNNRPAAVVVLGVVQRRDEGSSGDHVIPKPYHYAPLIRKIEQLLERSQGTSEPVAP